MLISKIVSPTYVDGPGQRTAVFLQGCSIRCQGCQNMHLWQAGGGVNVAVADLAEKLVAIGLPITITGGEPFDQAGELAQLLRLLCAAHPQPHVIVYSGYTFEQLAERGGDVAHALRRADVLVDGPYIAKQDAPGMQYRGSANQRAIDLPATLAQGTVVTLDWNTPEIIITFDGGLLGATPVMTEFQDLGIVADARRCGQTK